MSAPLRGDEQAEMPAPHEKRLRGIRGVFRFVDGGDLSFLQNGFALAPLGWACAIKPALQRVEASCVFLNGAGDCAAMKGVKAL